MRTTEDEAGTVEEGRQRAVRLLIAQRAAFHAYILAIVRDPELAEDVLQNVGLVLLRKRVDFDEIRDLPAWVRTVARLEAMNLLRKHRREQRTLSPESLDLLDATWLDGTRAAESLTMHALRRCLASLPERARHLLERRFTDNHSPAHIAADLQRPVGSVYVSFSRIYKSLQNCVERQLSGDGGHHG